MHIAILTFDGFNELDSLIALGILNRVDRHDWRISIAGPTSTMTSICNDYGYDDVFARQVTGHARPGDIVMLLSTSGSSPNVLRAAEAARRVGATSWAMTGPTPNPLASIVDEVLCVPAASATVQEVHLVAVHVVCGAFEQALGMLERPAS